MHWSIFPNEPENWAAWTSYTPTNDPALSFTAEECDRWLALAESAQPKPGTIGTDSEVNDATRRVEVVALDYKETAADLFAKLMVAATSANNYWWRFDLTHLANVEVLRYRPSGHYVQHVDNGIGFQTRKLSVVVMLSDPDDYKGGKLQLIGKAKPDVAPSERGTVVVFPSWLLHKVTPVTAGERRSMTAWVQGPAFR